jgi:hypothetical protein
VSAVPASPAPRSVRLLAATLLLIHAGLLLAGLWLNFPTVDEPAHFAAGVGNWTALTYLISPDAAGAVRLRN